MNADPTPTLMSIGRCFVGALHGPSDKANDKVFVVNWNSRIRMAPSSKHCSAQRLAGSHQNSFRSNLAGRIACAVAHCVNDYFSVGCLIKDEIWIRRRRNAPPGDGRRSPSQPADNAEATQ